MDYSIIEYFGETGGSHCGYCRGKSSSFSNGMWAHFMTCKDYQQLIDRGWRRSGKYCYKPTMDKTCCPQYTVKCDALSFKPSKSQKKVLKRFRNFVINGGPVVQSHSSLPPPNNNFDSSEEEVEQDSSSSGENSMDCETVAQQMAKEAEDKLQVAPNNLDQIKGLQHPSTSSSSTTEKVKGKQQKGIDPTKPKARKAKEIRKQRALEKLAAKKKEGVEDLVVARNKNQEKSLEDYTDATFPQEAKHSFEVRMVYAQCSNEKFMESFEESFGVYKKYQVAIHKDKPGSCTVAQFKRFLCNSSLKRGPLDSRGEGGYGYGAYHQQYVVDGRIVAVGVIDILPSCVSSVYLYYDPDYGFLSPGTLTSLYELAFVRKINKERWLDLKYYYMGYYIHSCPKMRYKAQYRPSWLLCPVTYDWTDVVQALPLLDKAKFSRLSQAQRQEGDDARLNDVFILYNNEAMPYRIYERLKAPSFENLEEEQEADRKEVLAYAGLLGGPLSRQILLFRP